jgi:virulence-associated protein VagC
MPDKARIVTTEDGQAVRLPDEYRFEGQEEVLIYRQGQRIILEPERHGWSGGFLDLAGSAPDFPDPDEPPPAEAGPELLLGVSEVVGVLHAEPEVRAVAAEPTQAERHLGRHGGAPREDAV